MIKKIKILCYICDHECRSENGVINICGSKRIISSLDKKIAKAEGWALGVDGRCYCPQHAPFHRNVGRTGKPRKSVQIKMKEMEIKNDRG